MTCCFVYGREMYNLSLVIVRARGRFVLSASAKPPSDYLSRHPRKAEAENMGNPMTIVKQAIDPPPLYTANGSRRAR